MSNAQELLQHYIIMLMRGCNLQVDGDNYREVADIVDQIVADAQEPFAALERRVKALEDRLKPTIAAPADFDEGERECVMSRAEWLDRNAPLRPALGEGEDYTIEGDHDMSDVLDEPGEPARFTMGSRVRVGGRAGAIAGLTHEPPNSIRYTVVFDAPAPDQPDRVEVLLGELESAPR